jgi:hypothetical protein
MRGFSTIFLLILLVSTQTPIGQLLKLPLLVEHFIQHQNKDGVSLASFLENHYSSEHNDADSQEDDQLPFKNITFYSGGNAIVPDTVETNAIVLVATDKKIIFPEVYAPHQRLTQIFRPPRM